MFDRFARHRPPTYDGPNDPTALEDEADNWWALARVGLEDQPGYGWTAFTEALKKRFYLEEIRWKKEQEFLLLQQVSMTVEEYTNKFVKLSRFITSVAMDELSRTRRYEKNPAPKVRAAMSGISSTFFQQAYDRALSIYDSAFTTEAEESAKNKFGQAKRDLTCYKCGKAYHPGTTCATGAPITCFTCKAPGHKSVDCPQKPKTEAPKVDAPKTGRVFVMCRPEADANPDVFTGAILPTDLIQFKLGEFDVILGMDWLARYDARFTCRDQKIVLKSPTGSRVSYQGVRVTPTVKWISALKMVGMGRKGHQIYLCSVRDVLAEPKLEVIPVVEEFPDVFPDDLPGIPHERDVEFSIELLPGTDPISKAPYHDILIYSRDEAEHESHLRVILETLRVEEKVDYRSCVDSTRRGR
ncbi:uncharacterized protein LOC141651664 [Silene latifolia]|uniref:uncharacterized protein LOC141651664 n=1 Tax=Silene latifolia TaxID=37657 RepID=UPI003D76DAF2